MKVHLIDGTYELFRHFFAVPPHRGPGGIDVGAARGVLGSMIGLLEEGATHVGVATDHVIESFRNELYPGYKTGEGIEPTLRAQFEPMEEVLEAAGFAVFRMVEFEADDGLAAAASVAAADPRVEQVIICSPDKDLAQCVVGNEIVQFDRRKRTEYDAAGVREKFGVDPGSIPDYLALVGDNADGFPGLPGWGAKSASAVLGHYGTLEKIPADPDTWSVKVRGAKKLSATLEAGRADAELFRTLARLSDVGPPVGHVDEWEWLGPADRFPEFAAAWGAPRLVDRANRLAAARN